MGEVNKDNIACITSVVEGSLHNYTILQIKFFVVPDEMYVSLCGINPETKQDASGNLEQPYYFGGTSKLPSWFIGVGAPKGTEVQPEVLNPTMEETLTEYIHAYEEYTEAFKKEQ